MAVPLGGMMDARLTHDWWVFLVRGIVAILFGILALALPQITLLTLVILFGVYALVDGISSIARAFSAYKRGESWIWSALAGVVTIAAGIVAFVLPDLTALVLIYLIGAWALISGVFEIIAGIRLRHEIDYEWLMILVGAISVIFGIVVLARPGAGALALVWLIGFFVIVIGVERIALAFRLRDWQEHAATQTIPGTKPPAAA